MKIKEKIENGKEKVTNWCKTHSNSVIIGGAFVAVNVLVGSVCYLAGKYVDRNDVLKEWADSWEEEDIGCFKDADTGKLSGVLTKRFADAIQDPNALVWHEDGSFDFASDLQK